MDQTSKIHFQVETTIPTDFGTFTVRAYAESENNQMPHLALLNTDIIGIDEPTNVRIHSECMTGDVFGSNRCECGEQLSESLEYIGKYGGILIYLRQEGRGIGLINKLHAYNKQDEGYNTAEANIMLGHEADARSYDLAIDILKEMKVNQVKLLTNNPEKINAFDRSGIELIERIPIMISPKKENAEYLETKKNIFGHLLSDSR